DGTARLAVFLMGLYGAAAAVGGALCGLALAALARFTVLGALWHSAVFDEAARAARIEGTPVPVPEGARGPTWMATIPAIAGALALLGFMVQAATLFALQRFHSPMLITALVCAEIVGLALVATLVGFVLSALFDVVLRFGPRIAPSVRTAPGLL